MAKKKHTGGRTGPWSAYRKEYAGKFLDQYLETCVDDFGGTVKKVQIPTISGYARHIDVGTAVIGKWREKHLEFDIAIRKLLDIQQDKLVNEGLASNYNHNIAKLMLSSNHGMTERSDVTSNGKELPTPIIDLSKNKE